MNAVISSVALWLADFGLLSAVLLTLALITLTLVKQPAGRLAITKSMLLALFLLAALCTLPGWSLVHLLASRQPRPDEAAASSVVLDSPAPAAPVFNRELPTPALPASPLSATPAAAPAFEWKQLPWLALAVCAYAIGSAGVVFWLGMGALAARRLVRAAQPAPEKLVELLREITSDDQDDAQLLVSSKINVPVALGTFRPTILLPQAFIKSAIGNPKSEIQTILAHEAAHLRNHDLRWLAVSRLLLVLLWPQPLYWLLRRRMRLDQETLADAAAAEQTSRQHYAEQLVTWARSMAPRTAMRLSTAVGLWEGPSQLRQRIALLIDERFMVLQTCSRIWRSSVTVASIAAALLLSLITLSPPTSAEINENKPTVKTDAQGKTAAEPQNTFVTFSGTLVANSRSQANPNRKPNSIAGHCLDENGNPLRDVEVILFRVNQADGALEQVAEKRTDGDGNYRFADVVDLKQVYPNGIPHLPLGENTFWQLALRSPNHASLILPNATYTIARDGCYFEHKIPPAATLRGRITGPDGKPVLNALVVAAPYMPWQIWEGAKSARTNADGQYEIADAAPFDVTEYKKRLAEFEQRVRAGKESYEPASFPVAPFLSIQHPDFATTITDYEHVPGTRDVQLQPSAILTGRVVYGDSGQPAAGVAVHTMNMGSATYGFLQTQQTDSKGVYRFTNFPAGSYPIWAEADGWLNEGTNSVQVTAGNSVTVPDLVLTRGGIIRAKLIDSKTKQPLPLTGNEIAILRAIPDNPVGGRDFSQRLELQPDGTFEIHVLPGNSTVMLEAVLEDDRVKWLSATTGSDAPGIFATGPFRVAEGETVEWNAPVIEATGRNRPMPALLPEPAVLDSEKEGRDPVQPVHAPKIESANDGDKGAASEPIAIPIIVAKHVLLHGGKIIEWDDIERLIAGLPNPKLAQPGFYFTHGALPERQEEIRGKIWDLRKRIELGGHSWSSIASRTSLRYDAVRTAADLVPDAAHRLEGIVQTTEGKPVEGAEIVLCPAVDESIPYKSLDIYLRNERLRNPLDEIVTASDTTGQFAVYLSPTAKYYVVALHKDGFGLVRSDEFAKIRHVEIKPWAHIKGQIKQDVRFEQSADMNVLVPADAGWPELRFRQYSVDLGPPSPDGRFELAFIPPSLRGWLSRDVKGEKGSSFSLPVKEFKLSPDETLTADIEPPTDEEVKRIQQIPVNIVDPAEIETNR